MITVKGAVIYDVKVNRVLQETRLVTRTTHDFRHLVCLTRSDYVCFCLSPQVRIHKRINNIENL